jgi:hypothetical protein
MNLGLSEDLKKRFTEIIPVEKSKFRLEGTLNFFWLSGFIDAEGCFYVKITQASRKTGFAVQLDFNLTQHIRDKLLFRFIQEGLGCGNIVEIPENNRVNFVITKLSDIKNILIPLLSQHPLHGSKKLDLKNFIEIAELMENKEHLTEQGLANIRVIKSGMNTGRNHYISEKRSEILQPKGLDCSVISKNKRSFHTYRIRRKTRINELDLRGVSTENIQNSFSANNKYPRLGFEQAYSQFSYV